MLQDDYVNSLAVDALARYTTKSPVALVLAMWEKRVFVVQKEMISTTCTISMLGHDRKCIFIFIILKINCSQQVLTYSAVPGLGYRWDVLHKSSITSATDLNKTHNRLLEFNSPGWSVEVMQWCITIYMDIDMAIYTTLNCVSFICTENLHWKCYLPQDLQMHKWAIYSSE